MIWRFMYVCRNDRFEFTSPERGRVDATEQPKALPERFRPCYDCTDWNWEPVPLHPEGER